MNELPKDRPIVTIATMLDQAIREADGTTSAIRMVDRYMIPRLPEGAGIAEIPMNALIGLKSGDFHGSFEVSFRLRRPSGSVTPLPRSTTVNFEGGTSGVNFHITFLLKASERGLHYVEAMRGDEVIAAVPFTLTDAPQQTPENPLRTGLNSL